MRSPRHSHSEARVGRCVGGDYAAAGTNPSSTTHSTAHDRTERHLDELRGAGRFHVLDSRLRAWSSCARTNVLYSAGCCAVRGHAANLRLRGGVAPPTGPHHHVRIRSRSLVASPCGALRVSSVCVLAGGMDRRLPPPPLSRPTAHPWHRVAQPSASSRVLALCTTAGASCGRTSAAHTGARMGAWHAQDTIRTRTARIGVHVVLLWCGCTLR